MKRIARTITLGLSLALVTPELGSAASAPAWAKGTGRIHASVAA
jgi:hypothetical protein